MTVPIPEEAIEKAVVAATRRLALPWAAAASDFTVEQIRAGELRDADDEATRKHREVVTEVVSAAAPLIVAATFQALLDDAFPDEESDYHYGCERLLDLVRDGIPALRGEGQT